MGVGPAFGRGARRDAIAAHGCGKQMHHQRGLEGAGMSRPAGRIRQDLCGLSRDQVEIGEAGRDDVLLPERGDRHLNGGAVAAMAVDDDRQEAVGGETGAELDQHGDEGLGLGSSFPRTTDGVRTSRRRRARQPACRDRPRRSPAPPVRRARHRRRAAGAGRAARPRRPATARSACCCPGRRGASPPVR